MMLKKISCIFFSSCVFFGFLDRVDAQIIPDRSLPTNSRIETVGDTSLILQGTQRGRNLFHSFESFQLRNGQTGRFGVNPNISNIFSRVTGGDVSRIDGLIEATGTANLFFLNRNGIIFGPGASLNLGGSFFASTAQGVGFSDDLFFSDNQSTMLEDFSPEEPVSLLFNGLGTIQLLGNGHNLTFADPTNVFASPPQGVGGSDTGLRSSFGNSISLLGNDVTIDAGVVTSSSGNINVSGVRRGRIFIDLLESEAFDHSGVQEFGDVSLSNTALLDASGVLDSSINVFGQNIDISDTSLLLVSNFDSNSNGRIVLNASDSIFISNLERASTVQRFVDDAFYNLGGLSSLNFSSSSGPDLSIRARNLTLDNAAIVSTASFAEGSSGNILLDIDNVITVNSQEIFQEVLGNGFTPSLISTNSFVGPVGDIRINSSELNIDGGNIVNQTSGFADGGNIIINSNYIEVSGGLLIDPSNSAVSSIGSLSTGSGDLGDLIINAKSIRLIDGGSLNYLPGGFGDSGSIQIRASEFVEIGGSVPGASEGAFSTSRIDAAITVFNPFFLNIFGLDTVPSGDAGTVSIETPSLRIFDGAFIGVTNEGVGVGGEILLNASDIRLDNQAAVIASTSSGDGGNISIESQLVSLNNSSQISASAAGDGLGGNIDIGSGVLVVDNSSISASAEEAFGGNIQINTQGFFVTDSVIEATSALGNQFDGTIEISTLSNDLSRDSKPQSPPIVLPKVEKICNVGSSTKDERLSIVDGVNEPLHPDDSTNRMIAWYAKEQDQSAGKPISYVLKTSGEVREYQRMVGWAEKPNGRIALTSDPKQAVQYQSSKSNNCLKAKRG